MSEYKKLIVKSATTTYLTVWTKRQTGDNKIYLLDNEGWDDIPEIRRTTLPKLFGDGDWISTFASFGNRPIELRLFSRYPASQPIRAIRQNLATMISKLNEDLTVSLTYYSSAGVETFKEELVCRVADVPLGWDQTENAVIATVRLNAAEPKKTVYLNGSPTAEVEKRL